LERSRELDNLLEELGDENGNSENKNILRDIKNKIVSETKTSDSLKIRVYDKLVALVRKEKEKRSSSLRSLIQDFIYLYPYPTKKVISFIFETCYTKRGALQRLLEKVKETENKKVKQKIANMIDTKNTLLYSEKKQDTTGTSITGTSIADCPKEIIGKIMSYV